MEQPTQPQPTIPTSRAFEAVVSVVGGLVAGYFGALANLGYVFMRPDPPEFVGHWIGLAGGLLAGLIWTRSMRARFEAGPRLRRLAGWGTLLGVAVGARSTLLLHLGLQAYLGQWDLAMYALGLAFGVPAGAVVGVLCALAGGALAGRARRKAGESPAADPGV